MTLQRPEVVKDEFGDEIEAYVEAGEVMAGDEPLSLRGTAAILGVSAGQVTAANLRWITIRHRGDIQEGWQITRKTGGRAGVPMKILSVREGETPDEMNLIARFYRG
jgi:head-tail adaptor